jgi:hypothetical protein
MSTFMEEVFDNSEDATEKDLLEYDKYKEQNKENIIQKFLYLNEQKLLKKNYILELVKDTILFPYVLEMEHLIGNIEGIAFTDEPTRILSRFFFPKINASIQQSQTDSFLDATNVALGVNDIFNTNYTIQDILNFNVFRYKTKLASPDKNNLPIYVNSYLLIRNGAEPEDNYFMFSEVQNKLLNQNITMELLDRVPAINQIKEIINNQKEKSNVDSTSNTNGEISN